MDFHEDKESSLQTTLRELVKHCSSIYDIPVLVSEKLSGNAVRVAAIKTYQLLYF